MKDMTTATSQSGIKGVTTTYESVELMRGILKVDDANINQFDVKINGYGVFFWMKLPPFMVQGNKTMSEKFQNLTEKMATSFDGINDMSVNTDDVTGGYAGNSFKTVTNLKDDFDTFTIKVYEQHGSPIREALEYWMTGVRDPKTGIAHYHGQVGSIEGGYCAKNHTGEVLFIETDATLHQNGIEYSALICNVLPTKVPKSHLNYSHGDHGVVQMDLEFSGVKYESKAINEYAKRYLATKLTIEHYLEFDPTASLTKV